MALARACKSCRTNQSDIQMLNFFKLVLHGSSNYSELSTQNNVPTSRVGVCNKVDQPCDPY